MIYLRVRVDGSAFLAVTISGAVAVRALRGLGTAAEALVVSTTERTPATRSCSRRCPTQLGDK